MFNKRRWLLSRCHLLMAQHLPRQFELMKVHAHRHYRTWRALMRKFQYLRCLHRLSKRSARSTSREASMGGSSNRFVSSGWILWWVASGTKMWRSSVFTVLGIGRVAGGWQSNMLPATWLNTKFQSESRTYKYMISYFRPEIGCQLVGLEKDSS